MKVVHPRLLSGIRRHSWDRHTRLDTARVAIKRHVLVVRPAMAAVSLRLGEYHRGIIVAQKKRTTCHGDASGWRAGEASNASEVSLGVSQQDVLS